MNSGNGRPAPKFALEVIDKASKGDSRTTVMQEFARSGGHPIVVAALEKAQFNEGEWRLVLTGLIRIGQNAPLMIPVRPAANGVIVKVRMGSSGAGVEGCLTPPHGTISALQCHQALIAATQPDDDPEPEASPQVTEEPVKPVQGIPVIDLIVKHRSRLAALLEAPEKLGKMAKQRTEIQAQIDSHNREIRSLQAELDTISAEEANLTNFDPEALAMLLE